MLFRKTLFPSATPFFFSYHSFFLLSISTSAIPFISPALPFPSSHSSRVSYPDSRQPPELPYLLYLYRSSSDITPAPLFYQQRPYIAARWEAKNLPETFSLGDDSVYGGYSNKRLTRGRAYRVFLRAYAMKVSSNKRQTRGRTYRIFLRAYAIVVSSNKRQTRGPTYCVILRDYAMKVSSNMRLTQG